MRVNIASTSAVVGADRVAVIGFANMASCSLSKLVSISSVSSMRPRAILEEEAYGEKSS
jgi:hypothetical protein